ncbi:MAG: hypothetical protein HOW97_13325 [Catenulispora sp.]|nr:hypothetical protein [Catenulispora sp.]
MVTAVKQATSRDGLAVRVAHHHNPYSYLLNDDDFDEMLLTIGLRRAESIWRNHTAAEHRAPRGVYGRACMAFVLMDPTLGSWVANEQAVMAAVLVGAGAERFLPNAAAKAAGHRRLGRNYGEALHVDPHLCGTGGFRYGHSVQVRGVIAGSSSQTTDQDMFEARLLAEDFVQVLGERHRAWEDASGPGEWLADPDRPGPELLSSTSWFPGL